MLKHSLSVYRKILALKQGFQCIKTSMVWLELPSSLIVVFEGLARMYSKQCIWPSL